MAATVTIDSPRSRNQRTLPGSKERYGTLNLGSYASNGVVVTPAMFALRTLDHLDVGTPVAADMLFFWDKPNGKIRVSLAATAAEVGNGVDISTRVVRFFAKGQ